jgi:acyl-coenzyme A thioesterase PaaI-like protein
MDADAAVLSVEFKVNLLEPAVGDHLVARGRVVRVGRTITGCRVEAVAHAADGETVVALMTATIMTVRGRDISD